MNDLVFKSDAGVLTSSKIIAERFEKRHDNVLRDIEHLISDMESHPSILRGEMFKRSAFKNARNREYREFLMNRDGFSLLVMGFTGSKALEWKLKFISAFNEMESVLKDRSAMDCLNEAIHAMEKDKEIASACATGLSKWKKIRKQHSSAIDQAHKKAQLLLGI